MKTVPNEFRNTNNFPSHHQKIHTLWMECVSFDIELINYDDHMNIAHDIQTASFLEEHLRTIERNLQTVYLDYTERTSSLFYDCWKTSTTRPSWKSNNRWHRSTSYRSNWKTSKQKITFWPWNQLWSRCIWQTWQCMNRWIKSHIQQATPRSSSSPRTIKQSEMYISRIVLRNMEYLIIYNRWCIFIYFFRLFEHTNKVKLPKNRKQLLKTIDYKILLLHPVISVRRSYTFPNIKWPMWNKICVECTI